MLDAGSEFGFGLECGSKAELVAALPFLEQYEVELLCNGCKDDEMMALMVAGQILGRRVYPIIERIEEFGMLKDAVSRSGMVPSSGKHIGAFGVRVRLSTSGAGLWSESGGANSKFGISLTELIRLVEDLSRSGSQHLFRLLHFHLGSQIADIANIRQAVREAGRIYAWLRRSGIPVEAIDVGGGLGVNYEAGNTLAIGHINYDLDAYTSAIVDELKHIVEEEHVPHPRIVSESGRAITAHHSVLLVEVVGSRSKGSLPHGEASLSHPLARQMRTLRERLEEQPGADEFEEIQRMATDLRIRSVDGFREGDVSVVEKALMEELFWSISHRSRELAPTGLAEHIFLSDIEPQLVDHYLCDFSVFRSMVDYWAIGQRFPIMPVHRLNESPSRRATLDDLTCDSDGRVSDFVSPSGDKHFLEVHPLRQGDRYYLGFFLMGAYQDIMGDMHNLFGRVTEAHVYLDEDEPDNFYIEKIIEGASVREQLELVQYHAHELERRMNAMVQREVRAGNIRASHGIKLLKQYRDSFRSYTYLNGAPVD
ncbi:MAG: biosynthetic arginine decarboxylase [Bacteroidota bacterium]